MSEEWREIPGFEGFYEVSSYGAVRSLDRTVDHPRGQRRLKGASMRLRLVKGYYMVCLRNGRPTYMTVHKAVLLAFPSGIGDQARHLDGDRENNRAVNLTWGTAIENAQDRASHGTTRHGDGHPRATKSLGTVKEILRLASCGMGPSEIGRKVGLHRARVYEVTSGKIWRSVVNERA